MRLIFAGTPEFAAVSLRALLTAGHHVELVLTQPDRKAGRGKKLRPSPVKELAEQAGLTLFQPPTLREPSACERLSECQAQAMIVAAYGLILPPEVLAIPPAGCINVHASLLPRWRGAAPIQRAIEAGDTQTGITIMQMDAGLDTGPMLLTRTMPIAATQSGGQLHDQLAVMGGEALTEALRLLEQGQLPASAQPETGACYAHRLTRDDATINWRLPAAKLVNRVRAFDPVPGSATSLTDEPDDRLKIWQLTQAALPVAHQQVPGQVLQADKTQIRVACGDGQAVDLAILQRAGGRRLSVLEFQRGRAIVTGQRLVGHPEPDEQQTSG